MQKRYVTITEKFCLSYYENATNTKKPLKGLVMPLAGFTVDEQADDKLQFVINAPDGAGKVRSVPVPRRRAQRLDAQAPDACVVPHRCFADQGG